MLISLGVVIYKGIHQIRIAGSQFFDCRIDHANFIFIRLMLKKILLILERAFYQGCGIQIRRKGPHFTYAEKSSDKS